MIPNTDQLMSFPILTGISPHQLQIDLIQEKRKLNEQLENLEILLQYTDLKESELESIYSRLNKITELISSTTLTPNSVKRVINQFNLLNEYVNVNADVFRILNVKSEPPKKN